MTTHRSAFTLVELILVVAVIGIIAAIAIPNITEMQLKAKRGEAPVNVDGIKTAQAAYSTAHDTHVDVGAGNYHPRSTSALDKELASWGAGSDFDLLGWAPDGRVRCSYTSRVAVATDCQPGHVGSCTAEAAVCDVDDDDNVVFFNNSADTATFPTWNPSSELY